MVKRYGQNTVFPKYHNILDGVIVAVMWHFGQNVFSEDTRLIQVRKSRNISALFIERLKNYVKNWRVGLRPTLKTVSLGIERIGNGETRVSWIRFLPSNF